MAQFTRIEIATLMSTTGLVPLFYHHDIEVSKKVLKACYNGGARLLEFTSRGDFAFEVFAELNKYAIAELPGMALGVGSVTDAAAASLYMQLGANFIVTPVLREDIAIVCNRRKVLWSAGCATLTEIAKAEELGCDVVKLFPAGAMGLEYFKALKAPLDHIEYFAVGGINPNNVGDWFKAGASGIGYGCVVNDAKTGKIDFEASKKLSEDFVNQAKSN